MPFAVYTVIEPKWLWALHNEQPVFRSFCALLFVSSFVSSAGCVTDFLQTFHKQTSTRHSAAEHIHKSAFVHSLHKQMQQEEKHFFIINYFFISYFIRV